MNSHKAMVEAIGRVPNGNYDAEMTLDGYEEPVRLKLRMTVEDERIVLDYAGSIDRPPGYGINSPQVLHRRLLDLRAEVHHRAGDTQQRRLARTQ